MKRKRKKKRKKKIYICRKRKEHTGSVWRACSKQDYNNAESHSKLIATQQYLFHSMELHLERLPYLIVPLIIGYMLTAVLEELFQLSRSVAVPIALFVVVKLQQQDIV